MTGVAHRPHRVNRFVLEPVQIYTKFPMFHLIVHHCSASYQIVTSVNS